MGTSLEEITNYKRTASGSDWSLPEAVKLYTQNKLISLANKHK
jgi:hypothetical protein